MRMIFTLLYSILLLVSRTNALPAHQNPQALSQISDLLHQPPLSSSRTIASTLNNLSINEPQPPQTSSSSSHELTALQKPPVSPLQSRPKVLQPPPPPLLQSSSLSSKDLTSHGDTTSTTTTTKDIVPSPSRIRSSRQIPRDWLSYPTFNPTHSSDNNQDNNNYNNRRHSYSSSSSGLAYRSIFPVASNSNHYTNYYRNRNLYAPAGSSSSSSSSSTVAPVLKRRKYQGNKADSYDNNAQLNSKDSSPSHTSSSSSSSTLTNQNDNSGLEGHFNDITVNPDLKSPSSFEGSDSITPTPESRSAPATDSQSSVRLSSTLEMHVEDKEDSSDYYDDIMQRDAIGSKGVLIQGPRSKGLRQPKARPPVLLPEDQDSMIIFPENVSRSSHHLKHSIRPGKSAIVSSGYDDGASSYMPPSLQTLDHAVLASLRRLIEARNRADSISGAVNTSMRPSVRLGNNSRSTTKNNIIGGKNRGSSSLSEGPLLPKLEVLDIHLPPSCDTINEESGYCEEVDTYPKDILNQILKKSAVTGDVFQNIFGDSTDNITDDGGIQSRNDLVGESPLCNAVEHTIYPKVARNKEGKFKYVVNHGEYIQGVRVEKCAAENSACSFLEDSPTGYSSFCRQKYIYKKLLAFTPEGKAMTDTFKLPSCCVCYVKSSFGVNDRINGGNSDLMSSSFTPKKSGGEALEESSSSIISSSIPSNNTKNSSLPIIDLTMNPSAIPLADDMLTFPTTAPVDDGVIDDAPLSDESVPTATTTPFNSANNDEDIHDTTTWPFFRSF